MSPGLHVVFEGSDGSGKSTVSQRAVDYLGKVLPSERRVVFSRHPGATPLGQKIRHLVKFDRDVCIDPVTEQILMLADNSCFINTVLKPELVRGNVVVSDRSNFVSGVVYGYAGGVNVGGLIRSHAALDAVIDVLFILKCSWSVAKARMVGRGGVKCKIEERGDGYFERVCSAYAMLGDSKLMQEFVLGCCKRVVVVDADQGVDEVWGVVKSELDLVVGLI